MEGIIWLFAKINLMSVRLLSLIVIILFGCAQKILYVSESVVFTYRSQNHTINESAFLYSDGRGNFRLEVYSLAQPLYKLEVGKKICANGRCMSKDLFNKYELNRHYPANLIVDLLARKPISNLNGSIDKTSDGFIQRAVSEHFDISYVKRSNAILFRDGVNKILIAIDDLKGE